VHGFVNSSRQLEMNMKQYIYNLYSKTGTMNVATIQYSTVQRLLLEFHILEM
jgi:hypothetical protein